MASKKERDRYALELTRRFEEFMHWAIANWPDRRYPLLDSDFAAAKRDIAQIAGPKLGDGSDDDVDAAHSGNTAPGIPVDAKQYVNVTPAPWP